MNASGQRITLDAVSREAGVSRSWLYGQDDLRAQIERLRDRHPSTTAAPVPPDRQRASDTSLLRRLKAATARIRRLEDENRQLRDALPRALGEQRAAAVTGRDTPKLSPQKIAGPQ